MTASRAAYLARQRWFAGTEQAIARIDPLPWIREPSTGLGVRYELVTMADGTVYNVPACYRSEAFDGLEAALMDHEGGLFVYDALLDAHARTALLSGFTDEPPPGIGFETLAPLGLSAATPTMPLVAEQSNTSIIVGDSLLAKFFRIVVKGRNPDIEIGSALNVDRDARTAPVRGWITAGPYDLAMIYDYYPSATDGWDSARTSFRSLLASASDDPAASGADFAPEAHRLGATVRAVHRDLATLGSGVWDAGDLAELSAHLNQRFMHACEVAPELDRHREAAATAFAEVPALITRTDVQRVHGDLHLGQTLRTVRGWMLIDFEGEPGAPLDERTRLDSALRDVAGILRSFDYAPHSVLMQIGRTDEAALRVAAGWARRNHEAFLDGYAIGEDTAAYVLTRCYQIDKAAYEVAYEVRHRPTWAQIPAAALDRLLPAQ